MDYSNVKRRLIKLHTGLLAAILVTSVSIPVYACKAGANSYPTKQNTYSSKIKKTEYYLSKGKVYSGNKKVLSLSVSSQGAASFFQHINYKGYLATLQEGDYTLRKLLAKGIRNNDISSLKLVKGYQVTIYDGDNFTGKQWSFKADNSDFSKLKLNDKMTSVKIKRISTPTPAPTSTPIPTQTASASTLKPTATPTLKPTSAQVPTPTATPTLRPTPTITPTATPTLMPTLRPTPTVTPTSAPTPVPSGMNADEKALLDLVNKARADANLKLLQYDLAVANVAMIKAKDMVDNNYFSHTSPTYGSPFDMMQIFGITYRYAGENIAAGYTSVQDVFNGWMNSPGHKANILGANFTHCGFGIASGGTYGGKTWVQMFIGKP